MIPRNNSRNHESVKKENKTPRGELWKCCYYEAALVPPSSRNLVAVAGLVT